MTATRTPAPARRFDRPETWWGLPVVRALPRRLAPLVAATAGGLLIAVSYSIAATRGVDETHYAVFWAGMLLCAVPAIAVLGSRTASTRLRLGWLCGYALFTYLPKLLRDPGGPLFHDEIAHWRQTTNLLATGRLFQPNAVIDVISRFPGLHLVVASVSATTGLTVWQSAVAILVCAHLLVVLGAAMLGETLFSSMRTGAVVALLYSLNSSFLYFDTEFAYESLAIAVFVWCVACLAKAHRAESRAERIGWTAGAVVLGAGTVTIHHLTALILVLVLLLVTGCTLWARRKAQVGRETVLGTLAVFGATTVAALAWILLVAPQTVAYLSPYFGGGLSQLLHLFSGSGGGRTLFAASTEPLYERGSAFAAPVLLGLLALVAVVPRLRRKPGRDPWPPPRTGLGAFGLLYFPSVPFILVTFGAEGARRSWAFTYLGLAVLVAPVIVAGWDRLRDWTRARRATGYAVGAVLACAVLVGNVSAGLDESYRFPGPYTFGSDTRSLTPELLAAARWLRDNVGPGRRIVTDRYTGLGFVLDADSWTASPSHGFPAYDLFFDNKPPSGFLVEELRSSGYAYLVIDKRSATEIPQLGVFFEPDEPQSQNGVPRISRYAIDRYDDEPWTTKVFESDDYVIYRFDFTAADRPVPGVGR